MSDISTYVCVLLNVPRLRAAAWGSFWHMFESQRTSMCDGDDGEDDDEEEVGGGWVGDEKCHLTENRTRLVWR